MSARFRCVNYTDWYVTNDDTWHRPNNTTSLQGLQRVLGPSPPTPSPRSFGARWRLSVSLDGWKIANTNRDAPLTKKSPIGSCHQTVLRPAFTLLELMIALGLLGALLSVAWSLMGTFSLAEQRGWKITQRTQTLRAARLWLEEDLEHLSIVDLVNPSSQTEANPLSGTDRQCTLRIAPSLDPLPFFEQLMSASLGDMSSPLEDDDRPAGSVSATANSSSLQTMESGRLATLAGELEDFGQEPADLFPWSGGQVTVEYELSPMLDRSVSTIAGATGSGTNRVGNSLASDMPNNDMLASGAASDADDTQYELIRRERVDQTQFASEDELAGLGGSTSPADRLLTTADLYRQTDERFEQRGVVVRESRLVGLVRPRFQYCDGKAWRSQWDSRSSGRLPTAIALSFDFPERAKMRRQDANTLTDEAENDFGLDSQSLMSSGEEGMSYAREALVEVDNTGDTSLLQAGEREIQIILRISNQRARLSSSSPVSSANNPTDSSMGVGP